MRSIIVTLTAFNTCLVFREYTDAIEFEFDVLSIFQNCYKYNQPEHDVVTMAKKLEEVFKSKMARMPKETPQPPPAAKSSSQGSGASRLQQAKEAEAADSDDTSSDWNKRLLQVRLTLLCKSTSV